MAAEFRTMIVARHARIGVVGDPATATEAWLILHGYGMLARGILHWFRAAESGNRLLVAPEGLSRFYTELSGGKRAVGASWTTREELHHELEDQYQYVEEAVNQLIPAALPLQVHGFSQGVSTGARWT
ncbi:MAG: esterase, partial [Gemmatimonadota bacterium]